MHKEHYKQNGNVPAVWNSIEPTHIRAVGALLLCGGVAIVPAVAQENMDAWAMAGQNAQNTRSAPNEHAIGTDNVAQLSPRWSVETAGNVSATPTVANGTVYVPDFGGMLWAVDAASGQVKWKREVSDYSGIPNDASRTSPAVWKDILVIGQGTQIVNNPTGAYMLGIKADTGEPLWRTQVEKDPTAVITSSPVIDDGVVYTGVSSRAEALKGATQYRGSVVALDAHSGKLLWKTYIVPKGYTGGSVWGNTAAVDHTTGLLYVTTGNNFSVPKGVCRYPTQSHCKAGAPANLIDSFVALDLKTGKIVWSTRTLPADVSTNYNHEDGPDYDFGSGPNLFTATIDGEPRRLVGAGQKSGVYWALDPRTGKVVWKSQVGPGSLLGGMLWGTAADGKRIYVSIGNLNHETITVDMPEGKSTTKGGIWAAVDAATGKVLWRTADPQEAMDTVAMSEANGVVYAGSLAGTGANMYALDAATGKIKWSFESGGAIVSGAAIADGMVYWGSGYHTKVLGLPYAGDNRKLYAFELKKQ
ncbi:MAG TPA: PQQ-binding-like beta-propeller repeat protein [Paraburkholderia sp.]|uniref:outer membrane protein assembly factor BamB family protein n=1 Tax=Paraburkholderia sp. TaxID=1926495 RepID=UPI002ED24C20